MARWHCAALHHVCSVWSCSVWSASEAGAARIACTSQVLPVSLRPLWLNNAFVIVCVLYAEGLLAPFKGMAMPLAFSSLQNAIIFNIYGSTVRFLQRMDSNRQGSNSHDGTPSSSSSSNSHGMSSSSQHHDSTNERMIPKPWQGFVAGCAAGFGQVFAYGPIELVKLRLQLQVASHGQSGYMGPLQMVRRIVTRSVLRCMPDVLAMLSPHMRT